MATVAVLAVLWLIAAGGNVRRDATTAALAAAGGVAGGLAVWLPDARGPLLVVLPALALHLLVALPHGALGSSGRRTVVGAAYVIAGAGAIAAAELSRAAVIGIAVAEAVAAIVIGVALANLRYRRTRGAGRQRMQWLAVAVGVSGELVLILGAMHVLLDWPDGRALVAASAPVPVALALRSSARAARHVDRILAHTVSLAGLTAVVVGVYAVVVVGLGRVPDDDEQGLLALSMLAAAVAAVLYRPARDRFGDFANRLTYGERSPPDEVIRTFGSRLSRAVPMDELLLQLAESLTKSMGLRTAEVWTGTAEHLARAVSVPDRGPGTLVLSPHESAVVAAAGVSGPAWGRVWLPTLIAGRDDAVLRVAPVCHSGELLGLLVVDRGEGADEFSGEDDRVLGDLARQVAVALHNVRLDSALQATLDEVRRQAAELQASRARIVAAGDAERRRIERNLHDGAQQHLVAMAVNLRLARQLLDSAPGEAARLLDELAAEVQVALDELRALAHGIYPPLLMRRGLPEALSAAANRASLPTCVEAAAIHRYPPEVESAVYFCCLEGLQNAAKHAGEGARATVRVWEDEGSLRFEVADDGAGFETDIARNGGTGLVNMRDRLGAVGGTVQIESAPSRGTRVTGLVPLG